MLYFLELKYLLYHSVLVLRGQSLKQYDKGLIFSLYLFRLLCLSLLNNFNKRIKLLPYFFPLDLNILQANFTSQLHHLQKLIKLPNLQY